MIEHGTFDAWGLRTPPAWARRALEKGIIDESRFRALIRVASEDPAAARRSPRHPGSCSCRRRPTRSCTRWRA
jgi:hypothetical protein